MSLSSPGVALRWEDQPNTVHLLGFQQRQRDPLVRDQALGPLRLTLAPYPLHLTERFARMHHVVTTTLDWIQAHVDDRRGDGGAEAQPEPAVHLYIENYAFGMAHSSAVSVLCELGGVLRYHVWRRGWTFSELAPTTVKKHFAGHGRADKAQMATAFGQRGFPSMEGALHSLAHHHPQEDMIDAVAILHTGEQLRLHPETGPKKAPNTKRAKKRKCG